MCVRFWIEDVKVVDYNVWYDGKIVLGVYFSVDIDIVKCSFKNNWV